MRWVVSLLMSMLVIPIALALDVSFLSSAFHFTSDPINLSFSVDEASTCSYSITQFQSQPDFTCIQSDCTFASCNHRCREKTVRTILDNNTSLGSKNSSYIYNLSLELPLGFHEIEVSCANAFETSSRSKYFLYDPDPITIDWHLLSRERFTTNQESIFYAYLYGREKIDEVLLTLTLPDRSTKTFNLEGFTPSNGYVFSHVLDGITVKGRYLLNFTFMSNSTNLTLEKEFEVVSPGSFLVDLQVDEDFDIVFYDAISGASSHLRQNISEEKLLVADAFADIKLLIDEYFSLYLQNIRVHEYELVGAIYPESFNLETETVGTNKPYEQVAHYLIHLNNSLDYISKVIFNYSNLGVINPQSLRVFKADASSPDSIDVSTGEFYQIGSTQRPLYIDEENELVWLFVDQLSSSFTLVQERNIGRLITREPQEVIINLSMKNISLEGIQRDIWTFAYGNKEYSFLINTVDGAIVYFEFSPNGNIQPATVGKTVRADLDGDQTDDLAIYVNAITSNKVIFSAYLLTQPQDRDSLDEILGERASNQFGIYVSTPWFWVYLGLALLILFFSIIWLFIHGHKKPSSTLSKEEKEELDKKNTEKLPLLDSIRDLHKQGLDSRSIENRLIALGWPQDLVEKVLETEGLKKSVSDFSSEEKILLDYVQKQIVLGASQELIKKRLEDVGWSKEVVDKILGVVQ